MAGTTKSYMGMFRSLAAIAACSCGPWADAAEPPVYQEHLDLSYVLADDGTRMPIRTQADWQRRREHILQAMERVMGPVPRPRQPVPLDMKVVEERTDGRLVWRKISYCTDDPRRRVSAWLLAPSGAQGLAAVLCLHQTTPGGKDAPVGLSDRPSMHYALELARRGYATLSPDYPSLGEHQHDFDADDYASGTMKAIYDNMRAVDLLQSLPEVDGRRIGCIGHSLGGHNALFTAAFDERLKAAVTCCGFTRFARYKGGDLAGWSGPRYMPRIATELGNSPDRMPFDFTEILAAIAPRPVFVVAPLGDDNFDVQGVREAMAAAEPVYALLGAAGKLRAIYPDCGHDFPEDARELSYRFLDASLPAVQTKRAAQPPADGVVP